MTTKVSLTTKGADVGVIHKLQFTDEKTAIYANVQEYGSATTPAHPYIRPALDEDKRAARKAMLKVLKQSLK